MSRTPITKRIFSLAMVMVMLLSMIPGGVVHAHEHDEETSAVTGTVSGGVSAPAPTGASTPTYIASIAVANHSDKDTAKYKLTSKGYTVIDYDLNAGCGYRSDYVYMGYKTTTDPYQAIAGICFYVGENPPESMTLAGYDSWRLLGSSAEPNPATGGAVDLNVNAKGQYIYTYVRRHYYSPITEITINSSKSLSGYTPGEATDSNKEAKDLNAGCGSGSDYIYLHYKRFSADVSATYYYQSGSTVTSSSYTDTVYNHLEEKSYSPVPINTYITYDGRRMWFYGWREDTTPAAAEHARISYQNSPAVFNAIYGTGQNAAADPLTLSYNANGGTGAPNSQTASQYINVNKNGVVAQKVKFTIPYTTPTHPDKCAFLGWGGEMNGRPFVCMPGGEVTIDKNTTLVAQWKDHVYVDNICTDCGTINPSVTLVATVSKNGEVVGAYDTFDGAVNGVKNATEDVTIKLLQDATGEEEYVHANATLDLNGKTLTRKIHNLSPYSGYTLTVTGGGTIKHTSYAPVSNEFADAKVIIEDANLTCDFAGISASQGTATVKGGSITGTHYGVYATGTGEVIVTGGTLDGTSDYAVYACDSAVVTITGGTVKTRTYNQTVRIEDDAKVIFGLDADGVGASFPNGIKVSGAGLNSLLAEGAAYWQGDQMLILRDGLSVLTGAVTVKAVCKHEGGKTYTDNGDGATHSYICADCKNTLIEDHTYDENTLLCTCGAAHPDAVALVSKNGKDDVAYTTLAAAISAVADATADDAAVVTLLQNIDLTAEQNITSGVFTLDLNGQTLTGSGQYVLYFQSGTVTITDSGENGTIQSTNTDSNEGIVYIDDGTVNIVGGTICGSKDGYNNNIGGVEMAKGTLTLSGGKVTDCSYGVGVHGGTAKITGSAAIEGSNYGVITYGGSMEIGGNAVIRGSDDGLVISGGNVHVTGGSITGTYGGVTVNGGTVTISGGEITGRSSGVSASTNTSVTITGGSITANCGVYTDGTANISGGTITANCDIYDSGNGTITLTLAEGKTEGATFPDGISVRATTLAAILGDDVAYWSGQQMMLITDTATALNGGDVVIRKACTHSGEKTYTNNGANHSWLCADCQNTIPEDHTYDENTLLCVCGAAHPYAVAVVSKNGENVAAYTTIDDAISDVSTATADDNAVVMLLQDVDMISVYNGIFTLNLNGKTVKTETDRVAALHIANGTVTVTGGTISGTRTAVEVTDGTLHIIGGTITSSENHEAAETVNVAGGTVNMSGGTITGMVRGIVVYPGATVNITGGTIRTEGYKTSASVCLEGGVANISGGEFYDDVPIRVKSGSANVTGGTFYDNDWFDIICSEAGSIVLGLDKNGVGATFPGGIKVGDTTLNAILAEGAAYWQGGKQILPADDAIAISDGDVVIRKACTHSGEKTYTDNGTTHSWTCDDCQNTFTEDHVFDPDDLLCICGTVDPSANAVAMVTGYGKPMSAYTTLADAIAVVESCVAEEEAGLKLLQDIDLGESHQTITSGVFTLDLNDKLLTGSDENVLYFGGGTVTITDSGEYGTIWSTSSYSFANAVEIYGGTVTITGGTIIGSSSMSRAIELRDGTLTLSGDTVTDGYYGVNVSGGTAEIAGGTIEGRYSGVKISGGTAAISGGKVTSGNYGVDVDGGTATITGGTIEGNYSAVHVDGGTATITGGTIETNNIGVNVSGGTAEIAGGSMMAETYGVYVDGGTATITGGTIETNNVGVNVSDGTAEIAGGSISGTWYDINIYSDDETVPLTLTLTLAEGKTEGATFPGGISVNYTTLNAILAEGAAYWQGSQQILPADGAKEITGGDVVIKKACAHDGELEYANITNATHDVVCTLCSGTIAAGVPHDFTDGNGCDCGKGKTVAVIGGRNYNKLSVEEAAYGQDLEVTLTIDKGFRTKLEYVEIQDTYYEDEELQIFNPVWSADNKSVTLTIPGEYVIDDIIVSAFSAAALRVHANGGTCTDSTVPDPFVVDLFYGNEIRLDNYVPQYTREGYLLLGLNTKSDGSGENYDPTDWIYMDQDLDLYLNWGLDVPPAIKDAIVTRQGDQAQVDLIMTEEGVYYYAMVASGAEQPAIDTTGDGTEYDDSISLSLTELESGAYDLFFVFKDEGGLISEPVKVEIPAVDTYPIFVGDVQVTADNRTDILGNGTAAYDPAAGTLTLHDFRYTGEGTPIVYDGNEDASHALIYSRVPLEVNLKGENVIESRTEGNTAVDGIHFTTNGGNISFTGTGSLRIVTTGDGIEVVDSGDLTVTFTDSVKITEEATSEGVDLDADNTTMTVEKNASIDYNGHEEGIYLDAYGTSKLTIQDSANVRMVTDDEEGIYIGGDDDQILSITGGTVYCESDKEALDANTIHISGGNITALSIGEAYAGIYADDLTITGGIVHAVSANYDGIGVNNSFTLSGGRVTTESNGEYDSYGVYSEAAVTITGGRLEVLDGGIVAGGTITLDGVGIVTPANGQVCENEEVGSFVADENGDFADAVVITGATYSGWTEIEGDWYYYDPATNEPVTGVARVPYPETAVNGKTYVPNAEDVQYAEDRNKTFMDATEAWFLFDEDGVFQSDYTGFVLRGEKGSWAVNGMIPWHVGLVEQQGSYFYFCGDEDDGGNVMYTGDVYVSRNTTDREVVFGGIYTFGEDGALCEYSGITDMANGTKRYYGSEGADKARLMTGKGLTKVGDEYIYVRSNGQLVVNAKYYIPANDLGVVSQLYDFDANGYMVNPASTNKNGVYYENGAWFYYEQGKVAYAKGMINVTAVWHGADGSENEYTGWIYVRSGGQLAIGTYYITNVGDTGGLFSTGQRVIFSELGIAEAPKHGVVEENGVLYYYQNGSVRPGAGLLAYENSYIYVRSNGQLAVGQYWITTTNDLLDRGCYEFGADGLMIVDETIGDGIVAVGEKLYYYENGRKAYARGLLRLADGSYIYVRSNGELAVGDYWITNANGLKEQGLYTFGDDGKLIG